MANKTGTTKLRDVRGSSTKTRAATTADTGGNVVHAATSDHTEKVEPPKGEGNQVRHLNRQIVEAWLDTISPAEAEKVAEYARKKSPE